MCTVLNSLKSSPGPGLARTEIVLRFGLWRWSRSCLQVRLLPAYYPCRANVPLDKVHTEPTPGGGADLVFR